MELDKIHDMVVFLNEELRAGRIKICSKLTADALARVRFGPDGKVDPSTVDGSVRALALGAKIHSVLCETSLRDVQSLYFDILEKNFGEIYSEVRRHGASLQMVAEKFASDEAAVTTFAGSVGEFTESLQKFWEYHGPIVEAHLNELHSLKSVFGGDLFPRYNSNIACSVGLYMDSIVLPDPLSRILMMRSVLAPKELFRLVVKHSLNALAYRELALADVNPPLVVIAPDRFGLSQSYSNAVNAGGNLDALIHASRIFGREFESAPEIIRFVDQFETPDQIVAAMVERERLIFDSEWPEPLPDQLARYLNETIKPMGVGHGYGDAVYFSIVGRMRMSNDALLRSSSFGGSPLTDAPTSWKYLQWKYEYDAMAGNEGAEHSHTLISKALGSTLLSGLPSDALIELRKNGAVAELREIIGKGIGEIDSASDADVLGVADTVIANIDSAFCEHNRRLQALTHSALKFYGLDVGRYVINGGFGLASVLTGNTALGALAFISQMTGTPTPDDLMKRYKEFRAKSKDLRRSPVAAMFTHLRGNFGFS